MTPNETTVGKRPVSYGAGSAIYNVIDYVER